MDFDQYLHHMIEQDGSDIYLTVDAPPSIKLQGKMTVITDGPLQASDLEAILNQILTPEQRSEFNQNLELNLALAKEGIGRFRVNIFQQREAPALVIRNIKTEIPEMSSLGLPEILKDLILSKRGLILFVGATGSGKSTSLASLIDYRNRNSAGHIITIEDPIEFVHPHHQSIVNQREVGVDTLSYENALKNTLRQAPDVILIGEIRSQDTMEHAIAFAETGHLCLSTLHANNANQALDRIINFFPEERHAQLLLDLSLNIRGIISQRLIPTESGKRVAAIEILIGTPLIQDLIHKGDIASLKEIMAKSENQGMQTFDGALYHLHKAGKISLEEALKNADSANNLRLRIQLDKSAKGDDDDSILSLSDD